MIKVAIIGCGAIADSHIRAYQKFPAECQIVALVDLYPEKAAQKAQAYQLEAAVYGNYQNLIVEQAVDLVSICLPPFAHAPATIDLLNAGVHVLIEKPMATSVEECDAMVRAADANQRLLSVVAQNRFQTPVLKLKQVLDSGRIGKLLHAQVDSFWWRGPSYYDLWWRGTWEKEGGGCTMNHAVHHIDLFQWMMGMPNELQAVIANLAHENSEVEDFSQTTFYYPDGRMGVLTASLVHHGEEQQMLFQGERAAVGMPWKVRASHPRPNGFPDEDTQLIAELQAYFSQLPEITHILHDGQIANVLAAIRGEQPLLLDGREGRKTIELVMAIYQSASLGQRVKLPLTPLDPFYTRQGALANAPHFHAKTSSVENFTDNNITFGRDFNSKQV